MAVVVDLHGFQVHGILLQSLEGLDSPFHYVCEVVRVLTRGGREGCSSCSSTESQSVQKDPMKACCEKRFGTTAFFCAELNAGFSGTGLDKGICNMHPARSLSCLECVCARDVKTLSRVSSRRGGATKAASCRSHVGGCFSRL